MTAGGTFGTWLADTLERRDMSQADFARAAGVRPPTVTSYIRGDKIPCPATRQRIRRALQLSDSEYVTAFRSVLPNRPLWAPRALVEWDEANADKAPPSSPPSR